MSPVGRVPRLHCSTVCGISLDPWNPCLLRWQVDSLPLSHQGSPSGQLQFAFLTGLGVCDPSFLCSLSGVEPLLAKRFPSWKAAHFQVFVDAFVIVPIGFWVADFCINLGGTRHRENPGITTGLFLGS